MVNRIRDDFPGVVLTYVNGAPRFLRAGTPVPKGAVVPPSVRAPNSTERKASGRRVRNTQ